MSSGPAPDTTGPDDASMACPACQYALQGLAPAHGTQGITCPECGANSVEAPIQIAARARATTLLIFTLGYFALRALFYALATSSTARHMSIFIDKTPWQYFEETELGTIAGHLEFLWRIVAVPIAVVLLVELFIAPRFGTRADRRIARLKEIAYSMFVIELGIHVWWIVGP